MHLQFDLDHELGECQLLYSKPASGRKLFLVNLIAIAGLLQEFGTSATFSTGSVLALGASV